MSKAASRPPIPQQLQCLPSQHSREIFLFNEIATITAHTLDLQEIANLALKTVLEFFQIEAGLLLLWDHDHQRLTSVAARGFQVDYLHWTVTGELEKMIGPYLSRATEPLIILDVQSDQRLATSTFSDAIRHDPRFQSVVSIPLKYREEVNGFLNLASTSAAAFLPYPAYFYDILGNQIGLAIANARLYHHLLRSERRYRRIFEGSLDMIFVTDARGRILDMNPAGLALLGLPPEARSLLAEAKIRILAGQAGIDSIHVEDGRLHFGLRNAAAMKRRFEGVEWRPRMVSGDLAVIDGGFPTDNPAALIDYLLRLLTPAAAPSPRKR